MLAALAAASPASLTAQRATVTGRVVLGSSGRAVAGRFVVLHRITMGDGGPVDSVRTDASGRWRIGIPAVDSTAVYVVSAEHDSLAYFSVPLHLVLGQTTTADPLVVWDTSSSGPAILLRRRLLTVARPKTDGSREVLEILELENPGRATRVSNDTLHPTWRGAIPEQALEFALQASDFSNDVVTERAGGVSLFGPLQPQGRRQLSYRYVLGGAVRSLVLPIDQQTDELDLLFEDTATAVTAPGLVRLDIETIEQRRFARYRADSLIPGAPVRIAFPAPRVRIEAFLPYIVGLVVVAFGAGLWMALKRRPATEGAS
ncbi:MAG TPA: carboxypeptidase-like regulatory domain-containing protein [Gemmatimonadales bacterium]|nr:carboxypeptidase-like regulatory domain-containing protein [Gemmatimonadales bacterium]